MEDIKGFIELIIAGTYSAHTLIAYRNARGGTTENGGATKPRHSYFSAEARCLLAIALSYYLMASFSLAAAYQLLGA